MSAAAASTPRLVLLVGAPRSGTTWLQSLLGAHPAAATPQETDLFSRYVGPLAEAWSWQLRGGPDAWRKRRYKGLPAVLTTDEYTAMVREFVAAALAGIAALAPDATVLIEKSPSHSLSAEVVAAYAPQARVIHLVRDGRDVAASLVAAADSWGKGWAPSALKDAARSWVRHVRGGQQYRKLGFVYREVRYESLLAGDVDVLREIHSFCGLEIDDEDCEQLYKKFGLDAMAAGADDSILVGGEFAEYAADRAEPPGFFGPGAVGGWRDSWDVSDRLLFRSVAGPVLEQLGYEPDGRWAASTSRSLAYSAGNAARRAVAGAAHRVGRLGDRVVKDLP